MSRLFSPPPPPMIIPPAPPTPPAPMPDVNSASSIEAARQKFMNGLGNGGRDSTILDDKKNKLGGGAGASAGSGGTIMGGDAYTGAKLGGG